MDQTVINFACYEDNNELVGLGEATLPDVSWISNSLSGAGIAGNIDTVVLGHLDAMTLSMKFHTLTEYGIRMNEPRRHNIDLRVAQQDENTVAGTLDVVPVKHVMVVIPKSYKAGNVTPAAEADASGEYAVRYWAVYIDGKKVQEIDPLNYICFVNGKDYLAGVRAALGK